MLPNVPDRTRATLVSRTSILMALPHRTLLPSGVGVDGVGETWTERGFRETI